MNSPVRTTVEHRRLVEGGKKISFMGEEMIDGDFEKRFTGAAFVNLEGVGGYVFPKGENVLLKSYEYDPRNVAVTDEYTENSRLDVQQFFELGIEHGANPKDATYSYFILPLSDENSTRVYASRPEVEILSNTKELQAVRKESLGITAAAMFAAGEIGPIKASVPCIIMYKELGDEIQISVCDPTQKLTEGALELDGEYSVKSIAQELSAETVGGKTLIKANFENLAGYPLRLTLEKK